jgi:hypothetical protein
MKYEIEYKGRSYTIVSSYDDEMTETVDLYNQSGKHIGAYKSLKQLFDTKFSTVDPTEVIK